MIGSLKGKVDYKTIQYLILDVSGVGYKVYTPADIISRDNINCELKLFIHTHVKDDALDLYGFLSLDQMKLFELLISVSGVGPKTALNVFSLGGADKIKKAIASGDTDFFIQAPRLGKKNAQKIIIELRSKLGVLEDLDLKEDGTSETKEILEALRTFGFEQSEAREALKAVGDEGNTSQKIRAALKYLGK